ncbi:MAG: peroxiredoxin [Gammaproteobacteria bacterium]|nr:MAG: peroxiredoxin [Gammaproteobacteria bacterium]
MLTLGDNVPDFTGQTNDGEWTLSAFRGKKVIIYFYPRDNTPGCTTQSNDFNAHIDEFAAKNTVIVGVSNDSLKKHQNFSDKYGFKFPLIADEDKSISELFGVYQLKKFMGKTHMGIVRSTFLIDENGQLLQQWRNVKVKGHVASVLSVI